MILKGKRLILRPMTGDDAPLTTKWACDPEINKFTTRKGCTLKEIKDWITKELPKDKNHKKFAIDVNGVGYIGNIGLYVDKKDNFAEYDIIIGNKEEWGKGYAYEASKLLLDYGFEKLKVHYVYLHVYSYTDRAIKLYERLGFKKDGVMRESVLYKGNYYDKIIMGLLAEEWEKKKCFLY